MIIFINLLLFLILYILNSDNEDPMVRGLALRSLSSLRMESIIEYIQQPIQKSLNDISPYVRKNGVMAVLKVNIYLFVRPINFIRLLIISYVNSAQILEYFAYRDQRLYCTALPHARRRRCQRCDKCHIRAQRTSTLTRRHGDHPDDHPQPAQPHQRVQ